MPLRYTLCPASCKKEIALNLIKQNLEYFYANPLTQEELEKIEISLKNLVPVRYECFNCRVKWIQALETEGLTCRACSSTNVAAALGYF